MNLRFFVEIISDSSIMVGSVINYRFLTSILRKILQKRLGAMLFIFCWCLFSSRLSEFGSNFQYFRVFLDWYFVSGLDISPRKRSDIVRLLCFDDFDHSWNSEISENSDSFMTQREIAASIDWSRIVYYRGTGVILPSDGGRWGSVGQLVDHRSSNSSKHEWWKPGSKRGKEIWSLDHWISFSWRNIHFYRNILK